MNAPIISIIVPCYNYGPLLSETLRCLQQQTFSDWECIIVDDGSTDETAGVSLAFCNDDKRFSYIYQKNKGLSAARNTGLKAAIGDFIQLLDADDLISARKLELQLGFMKEHPEVGISYTDAVYFKDADTGTRYKSFQIQDDKTVVFSQRPWIKEMSEKGLNMIEFFIWDNIAPVNSMLINKDVFHNAGYFKESFRSLEDWDFWARCAFANVHFAMFKSTEAYALIRVHSDSMSFNNVKMKLYLLKLQVDALDRLKKSRSADLRHLYRQNLPIVEQSIRQHISDTGIFNKKQMTFTAGVLKRSLFFKLYLKELNTYRKRSHPVKNFSIMAFKFLKNKWNESKKYPASFLNDFAEVKKLETQTTKRFKLEREDFYPCLNDKTSVTPFDRRYIYHPAWAARVLSQVKPQKHIDISSTLYFCSIISAFIPVDFYDYRPANLRLDNFNSLSADLLNLPFQSDSVESISCMHTVEHVGLGRYGDQIDYNGDIMAVNELKRVVMPGGHLIFVVPLGRENKICFNAHRIYTKQQILALFNGFELRQFSLIPEDERYGGLIENPSEEDLNRESYGCGCFWFIKQ